MPYFDEIFKHLVDRDPYPVAVLALNTPDVEVVDSLSTEQPTVKMHHSDMTFKVRLPDEEAILHIEAQTDDSTDKPMPLRSRILEGIMQESPFYELMIQREARQIHIENTIAVLSIRFPKDDAKVLKPKLEGIEELNRLKRLNLNASVVASFLEFEQQLEG